MTQIKVRIVNEINKNCLKDITDLNQYALISYFINENISDINCEIILNKFSITFNELKAMLEKLRNKKVIELVLNEDKDIVLEIQFLKEHTTSVYNNIFEIDNEVFNNMVEFNTKKNKLNEEMFNTMLFKYLENNNLSIKKYEINNEDEYIDFIMDIRPHELIMSSTNSKLSYNEFMFLCDVNKKYNFSKEIINLAIDYCITTSVYKRFNVKFTNIILNNWHNNDINEIDRALKYIKDSKNTISSKGSKFVEPTWDDMQDEYENNYEEIDVEIKDEKLIDILKKVYEDE